MIDTNSFYISKDLDGTAYHVKTASQRSNDQMITVTWTKHKYKAKRFNGTPNVRKFTESYAIKHVTITVTKNGVDIERFPLEELDQ